VAFEAVIGLLNDQRHLSSGLITRPSHQAVLNAFENEEDPIMYVIKIVTNRDKTT
jgi:hypothetical protein